MRLYTAIFAVICLAVAGLYLWNVTRHQTQQIQREYQSDANRIAVLGVALTNVQNGYNLIQSIFAGFGTAVGYTVAIVLLAAVREHLDEEAIPAPFRGAPIVLLCAALMAMAFMGFSGLV